MYLIVLPDTMKLVCKMVSYREACLIAELDFPDTATDVFDNSAKGWAHYGRIDLKQLLTNHEINEGSVLDYPGLIALAKELADSMPADRRSMAALEAKAGPKALKGDVRAIEKVPRCQPPSIPCKNIDFATDGGVDEGGAPKPPRLPSGPKAAPTKGATGRVWELADALLATNDFVSDPKGFRKLVIQACESEGLNAGTAATQFGKWKTSKGL